MKYILLFLALLAGDMGVKYWASTVLKPKVSMEFIPHLVGFTYAENKGAAFSMLSGARWFFVVIAVIFLIVLSVMFRRGFFTTWYSRLGAVFIAAGTVGNAIDRLRYGFVVYMFDLKFMKFAIFNVADLYITAGAILFGAFILLTEGIKKDV